jgi:glucose/arabinose dehydrogenase
MTARDPQLQAVRVIDGACGATIPQPVRSIEEIMKLLWSSCSLAVLTLAFVVPWLAQQDPARTAPVEFATNSGRIRAVTVASGLVHPWSLAFLPDGHTILVAEQVGRLRAIRDGELVPEPVWTAQGMGTDVLHGLDIHPQFAQNHLVYVSYLKAGPRGFTLAVARGKLDGTTLKDVADIFVADAWESAASLGIAGRIMFGPDNTLYVAVGDRDLKYGGDDNSMRMRAQALDSHIGKVLRIRDDGSVPNDNPFVGKPGARPEIFTYGHRNTYGFAFHPTTGELWQAEIGPMGGDEVNILIPGANYGWPLASMGRNYTGNPVSDQPSKRPGMEDPRMFWAPSISPSSILFYTGNRFPSWKGNLFVGALNGQQLLRVAFNPSSQGETREPLLASLRVRIRDVRQGPDGLLYVATELRFGGTTADGTVLRIEPAN